MLALLFRLLVPEAMMFGPHRLGVGGTVWVRGCGGACALCVPLSCGDLSATTTSRALSSLSVRIAPPLRVRLGVRLHGVRPCGLA
jgi:hypothetical protein